MSGHNGIVLHHRATKDLSQIKACLKATILIGPEGGLSEKEISVTEDSGYKSVLLGRRFVRTETASLAAIANMQLVWGN